MAGLAVWLLLLDALAPALVLAGTTAQIQAALLVQCVVVLHAGLGLARVLTDRTVRPVAFGFWLFTYIWLGLAPLAMLATDTYPWPYRTDARIAVESSAILEIGLLAYSLGSALAGRRADARAARPLERVLDREIAPVRLLMLCLLSLALAAYLIPKQGGLSTFFTSRQAITTADSTTGGGTKAGAALAAWGLTVPAYWSLLGLLQLSRSRRGDRLLKGARLIALPVMLVLNGIVNNPISNPRFWAGTVLLTVLFALPALRRPRGFRIAAAGTLAVILVIFPYSDYFRYTERGQVHVVSMAQQFTTNPDYDAYQQVQTGLAMEQRTGFQPQRLLGPPLFWLPRAYWPGKPEDTGIDIAQFAGYDFTNLSAPLWIESYLWAGIPSLVAAFALLGAVGRRIDEARQRLRARSGTLSALLVPAFGFYQLILLRGSLLAATAPLALLVFIPLLISTRRRALPAAAVPAAAPTGAADPAPAPAPAPAVPLTPVASGRTLP
ncbi:hypothetical protein GXW83_21245 [Streptacidiphilus sp. PB12-B1b]|nr:hypothetical protein GXW83_21245 [Streptacidiphilus sp. PB12-B1b]